MSTETPTERTAHRVERKEKTPLAASPSPSPDPPGLASARPPCLEVPPLHGAEYRFILRCESGAHEETDENPHQHLDPWRILDRERKGGDGA